MKEGFIDGNWNGKGKTELRDHLRRQPNGDKTWMKLQGRVYGKYMHRAEMLPGVANFLLKCKAQNHNVFIISHKTEYGHFDPEKILLRQEALKWMEAKRFFDQEYFGICKENVFFADTRIEKVNKIALLKCDWFIDDLPEVFTEVKFPSSAKKILFGKFDRTKFSNDIIPMSNWGDISNYVLGYTTDDDFSIWANLLLNHPVANIEKVSGRGNSRVYKVQTDEGSNFALKYYPDRLVDVRPRLKTEFHALRLLHQNNITNVPKAVEKDEDLNIGIYEWIAGEQVSHPKLDDLEQVIHFLEKLQYLSLEIGENEIELASEACLSANELVSQIEIRLLRLKQESKHFQELSTFLDATFEPLLAKVKDENIPLWPLESLRNILPQEKQTLSPSDFGFHNVIRRGDGKIIFIDFDYFGWDDPVKLTADFIWHPGMELDSDIVAEWENAMLYLFSDDPDFADRLKAAMPLYGMRWVLIVLNEFLPGFADRRKEAGITETYDIFKSRETQLDKAKRYCDKVKAMTSQVTFA
ncbi:aminoglycoside phosphotransferase family protein [candidate division KSB1 bacterium]|nr:aminoglycoside phosphotransferase family protein [candidate division KSB1 bacterium]